MKRLLDLKQASDEVVSFVLENACIQGKANVLEFILREVKPRITIELFRLASVSSNGPKLLEMLVKHGGNPDTRHDTTDAQMMTPLHDLVGSGKVAVIRTLVNCGADVNARDGLGRTPLMILASSLEGIEISNGHAVFLQQSLASGNSRLLSGEPPRTVNCLEAVQTLLALGADATLVDNSGNDAIDHYSFEYFRCNKTPAQEILQTLREAGAKGSATTLELFVALKTKNLTALDKAIKDGADINRLTPPPVPSTPLTWAAGGRTEEDLEIVRILLKAGADPNKLDRSSTPLIRAARSGNLAIVKELVDAGADIHAVYESGDFIENAYSAADDHEEVRNYLKSLGAGNPKHAHSEPLKPGVGSWNDFGELLIKTTVEKTAEALSKIIDGKAQLNVYGQSFSPGKKAYVVVKPQGMEWCNIFQIAPPRLRFEDEKELEDFAAELAKVSGASVLSIQYSDTSDAAAILRIEPDGKKTRDQGWDHDSLKELVEAMGNEAPAWAKKQLAKTDEDEPTSTERLVMLAEHEKFVVAAFGLYCEPSKKIDVEFTGYGSETFDNTAFVSN
jgi:ankyrin repeat protein